MRLAEIATRVGGTLEGDGEVDIRGVSSIEATEPGTLTFVADPRHERHLDSTRAAAVLVGPGAATPAIPAVRVADPHLAFVTVIELLYPAARPPAGIHPTA